MSFLTRFLGERREGVVFETEERGYVSCVISDLDFGKKIIKKETEKRKEKGVGGVVGGKKGGEGEESDNKEMGAV